MAEVAEATTSTAKQPGPCLRLTPAVFALSLMCILPAPGASVDVRLCIGIPAFSKSPSGQPVIFRTSSTIDSAAAVRAVHDVNSRNCTVLGAFCDQLVAVGGGEYVRLQPFFINPASVAPHTGPVTLINCEALGGHALVGLGLSQANEAAALLSRSMKIPIVSHMATSPYLSEEALFDYFSRTAISAKVLSDGFSAMYGHFGWTKAVVIHETDTNGYSYAEAFDSETRQRGILVESIGIPPLSYLDSPVVQFYDEGSADGQHVREGWRKAVKLIMTKGYKVVHLAMQHAELLFFTNLALDEGLDVGSIFWSAACGPSLEELSKQLNNPGDLQARNQSLRHPGVLHGMVSLEHGTAADNARLGAQLAKHLSDFRINELTDILRDSDGSPDDSIPENFIDLIREYTSNNHVPHTALNAYDMVWAAAAAFAAAARRGPGSEAPLGEAANAEIKNVSFNGASGPLWFESNGDRGLRNHQLEIQNLLWDEASLSYVHRTVGLVQTGTGQSLTIDLYRDPALVWPDGTEYPEIFGDGTANASKIPQLIVPFTTSTALVLVVIIALVGGFCVWRQCTETGRRRMARRRGPPQQGDPVTLAITDIHGSTTLWDMFPEEKSKDILRHHEAARGRLKEFQGYEVATEGDSFICAFHTPEDAICWSTCFQLDLLCAPWTDAMEPGGDQFLRERRDWANCSLPPLLDSKCRDVLLQLMNGEELISSRNALAKGHIHAPLFSVRDAASTAFSKRWFATHGLDLCCLHRQTPLPLPIFRGIRVRIGIHSGIADVVTVNGNGQRVMYGGRLSQVAKAIADAPCGGQIIMSGESLAQIESIQALKKTVAAKCAGWRHSSAKDDETMPAGLSVMHLGSHVILQQQLSENAYEMPKQDLSERGKKVERRSWKQRAMRRLKVPNSVAPSRASPVIEQDTQLKPATSSIRLLMNMDALNEAQAGLADDAPCAVDLSTLASMWQDTQKTSLPDTETGSPRDESEAIGAVSHTLAEPIPTSGGKAPLPPPATGSPPPVTSATLLNAPARPLPATTAPAAHEGGGEITAVKAASETFIHELVMVSPWPLMQRALYFPPPSTIKQVTPAWHEAPRAEGVTILFTNVENMGKLKAWENQTRSPLLDGAMRLMRQVVCDCLSTHNGYEVNETEANFVCAFHSPVDAVKFAASLQFNLIEAPWDPAALLTWWGCAIRSSNGAVIFKGLRIAVGMCTGDAFRAHPSEKSGRMEYFGPIMNHAARVAMAANGGQVLLHERTFRQLSALHPDGMDKMIFRNMGRHALKGIHKPVFIVQGLEMRDFPPIHTISSSLMANANELLQLDHAATPPATGSGQSPDTKAIEEYVCRCTSINPSLHSSTVPAGNSRSRRVSIEGVPDQHSISID